MAQLTIYLDDESIKLIESAAAREKSSVSRWVKKRLLQSLEKQWPSGYFDLLGTMAEEDWHEFPKQDFSADTPRESM